MRPSGSMYLGNRKIVGRLGQESALRTGIIQSTKTQEHRKRILNHLGIALAALPCVLVTGSLDQLLVQRQIDLARGH